MKSSIATSVLVLVTVTVWPAVAQDAWNVEYVGGLPGYLEDVQVQGSFAYCAARSGLLILDVTAVQGPTQVAFLPMPEVCCVAVSGQYAYVGGPRLHVVDVSDPASPIEVGSGYCETTAVDVVVAGNYAYVADNWRGVRILDISQPAAPHQVGYYLTSSPLGNLCLVGNLLYFADELVGLRILDVSVSSAPVQVSIFNPWVPVHAVAVAGSYAYIATVPGMRVVDVSDPAHPVEVAQYDADDEVVSITMHGDYAILSFWEYLEILDVSMPAAPVVVSSFEIYGRPGRMFIADDTAYIAAWWGGLRICDVADPAAPASLGYYALVGDVTSLDIVGSDLYLCGGYRPSEEDGGEGDAWSRVPTAGLFIIDTRGSSIPVTRGFQGFWYAMDAVPVPPYAYLAGYYGAIGVLDVSEPTAPQILGETQGRWRALEIDAQGNYAYVVHEEEGLSIIDVSVPTAPMEISNIPAGSHDVDVRGDYAYVAQYYYGLEIVDVSDPTSPVAVGGYQPDNWSWGVAVAGNYAYLANGARGLCIVDVSDPADPFPVGLCDTPGHARKVAVQGQYAYVADDAAGIRVIDVSVPSAPVEAGYFITTCAATEVAVWGNQILAGLSDGGLMVLQSTFAAGVEPQVMGGFVLEEGQPNPFTPQALIRFTLSQESLVRLGVFSTEGRRVASLLDGRLPAGPHEVVWTGNNEHGRPMPAGTYFCRLDVGVSSATRRVVLVR